MAVLEVLIEFVQRHPLAVAVIALITFPILTYVFSKASFYRKANSKRPGQTPPTIPYWIPGLFHSFNILASGPPKYFGDLVKEYGNYAPFTVKAGPLSFLVLRDPNHIRKVFQATRQMTPNALHVQVYDKVMGAPKNMLDLYRSAGTTELEKHVIDFTHLTLPRKYLMGTGLVPISDVYTSTLSRHLQDKMFQIGTWTQIEDLWSFFQQVVTRTTIETLFGTTLLKQYPKIVQDYWMFDEQIENFTRGMPRFMMPAAYAARDRLHENLKKWLKATHSGSESSRLGEEDPAWDENMGTKFIQERDDAFLQIESLDIQARTAEILSVLQGSNSNLVPSSFWTILEVLRKPHLTQHLTTQVAPHCPPITKTYDMATITNMPIVQSIHTEIGRLRMATGAIRTSEVENFELDERWKIPKGTSVMIFSHDVSMNTDLWAKARSQTAERPLEDFWAERFLVSDRKEPEKQNKSSTDKIRTGRFSMDGLGPLHVTFGGGTHLCPGRNFARMVQAGTLAVLLNEFEIELCDPEATEAVMPPVREIAYGTIRPLDKVAVRIRKRREVERF